MSSFDGEPKRSWRIRPEYLGMLVAVALAPTGALDWVHLPRRDTDAPTIDCIDSMIVPTVAINPKVISAESVEQRLDYSELLSDIQLC